MEELERVSRGGGPQRGASRQKIESCPAPGNIFRLWLLENDERGGGSIHAKKRRGL